MTDHIEDPAITFIQASPEIASVVHELIAEQMAAELIDYQADLTSDLNVTSILTGAGFTPRTITPLKRRAIALARAQAA